MSEPENDKDAPKADAKPKKKGRFKLLAIGMFLFVLLTGGGAGAWWYFNQPAAESAQPATEEAIEAGMVSLESFIANLADPGGRKYLRVTIVLLVPSEETATRFEANKLTVSRVRAAVLEVLNTRSSADLATLDGRADLKKAIAETVNRVAHLDVRDVLFEEFLVQ